MSLKRFAGIILTAIILVTGLRSVKSQDDSGRKVAFESILINNNPVVRPFDNIVIKDSDTITFNFRLEIPPNAPRDPMLFRYTFGNEAESITKSIGVSSLSYQNLSEGKYNFEVSAFDLQRRWEAEATKIIFEVDNDEAELAEKLATALKLAEEAKAVADSIRKASSQTVTAKEGFPLLYLIISGGGGALIAALIMFLLMRGKKEQPKAIPDTGARDAELENAKFEASKLRGELSVLRGQIDAMQQKSNELTKQNKELQANINKLSKSKDELEELQKQKDDLFAVIIHDIKNPASLIKNLVELLSSYDLTATEQQDVINDIAQTTAKIVMLSQEVSKILAIESNKLRLDFEHVNLNDVASDVFQRNTTGAKKKLIHFLKEFAEDLPNASMDPNKVDEAIDNLVSNGIKFTQKGGTVRVKTYRKEDSVVLEVSDNGLGLTEDDIKKAFKRGARLSAKPTDGENSSGLGLWIVKKMIEAHNGRVWVRSQVGKGSTFAFSIPLLQPDPKVDENFKEVRF